MSRWENENWTSERPDPDKVVCKDCFHREKDRGFGGTKIPGCTLAMCQAYAHKPVDILISGVPCPYYLNENGAAEIPNAVTLAAMQEVEEMGKHPGSRKTYNSFSEMLQDLESEEETGC